MMRIILTITALALTGCVTAAPIYTADGRKGHAITCSGAGLYGTYVAGWHQCFERAGELCGAHGS
jgi:hypothetical protein